MEICVLHVDNTDKAILLLFEELCIMTHEQQLESTKKQILAIIGDEFSLASKYRGADKPLTIHHNVCNTDFVMKYPHDIIRNGRCRCNNCNYPRKYTTESFKEKVREINPDIEVLGKYVVSYEKIKMRYIPDNKEFYATPQAIYRREGYPFKKFGNTTIIIGVNDMWTTHPHIASFLLNKEDGFKFKYGTN